MKFRSAFAVLLMTVALTACGELPFQKEASQEAETPGHSGPPAVSPLEQPIETGADAKAVATAEASTMATTMFRASGAGWAVSADGKTAVYERAGAKSVGIAVRRMTYARGVEFIGTMNGAVFALNVQAAECDAGGKAAPFTARLRVGSQRLSGCAAPTDVMPKAQVRASSGAPTPKAQPKAAAAPAAKPAATKPAAEPAVEPAAEPAKPATTPEVPATVTPAGTPTETPAATPAATPTPEAPATSTPDTPAAPEAPAPASGVPAPTLVLPIEPPAASTE